MIIQRFSLLGIRLPHFAADTATAGGDPAAPSAPAESDPAPPPPVPATSAPSAPVEPAGAAQAAAPKKSNIFTRASSFLQDRGALVRQISDLNAAVAGHVATIAERDQTISTQALELADLRAGREQLETTVATLEKAQTTVSAGVVDAMAQIGVPQNALPASQSEDQTDDALLTKYESLTGGEKTEFLRKNREALRRAASAREPAVKK